MPFKDAEARRQYERERHARLKAEGSDKVTKRKETQAKYFQEKVKTDPEKMAKRKEDRDRWHEENSETYLASRREAYYANHEAELERGRRYHQENPDKIREKNRQWREENREYYNERQRAYRANNPHIVGPIDARHAKERTELLVEAQKKGRHNKVQWLELCLKFKGKCVCCGRDDLPLTRDHVITLRNGGSDLIDNIQPLCSPCNTKKANENTDYRY